MNGTSLKINQNYFNDSSNKSFLLISKQLYYTRTSTERKTMKLPNRENVFVRQIIKKNR